MVGWPSPSARLTLKVVKWGWAEMGNATPFSNSYSENCKMETIRGEK